MEEGKKIVRWSKTAVTDAGTRLLTEFAAGRILNITSAYGSIGESDDDLIELEELPDGRAHPLTIESVTKTDESVTVCIQVTSLGNAAPYKLDRIGIYAVAKDPVEPIELEESEDGVFRAEKLLMVIEDTEDEKGSKGVTIPAETDQIYTFKLYAVLTITNRERLEVSVSTAGIATISAVHDAINEHNVDMEAHAELLEQVIGEHNADPAAHPAFLARMRGMEAALNGSETIIGDGDPTTETEGVEEQHYINLQTGAEFVCTSAAEDGYTWEPVDTKTSMRALLAKAAETAALAKEVAEGASQAIAAVQNTISTIPSQSGSLTYNRSVQKPKWNNLATEMMSITYGEDRTQEEDFPGETNAGTYKAYVTPKQGYTWGDKSSVEREITWTIQRAAITNTPSTNETLTYTGLAQVPVWQNFNADQLIKQETAQTDAGEHTTSFTPRENYQWGGGDTSARLVQWTIEKAVNTFSVTPGGAQSLDVGDTLVIQVTANSDAAVTAESSDTGCARVSVDEAKKTVTVTGISQGTVAVTISSKGSINYTDASAKVDIGVNRKTPTLSISPSGSQTLAVGGSQQIAVTTSSDGAVTASSSAPWVATASANGKTVSVSGASSGTATITVSVQQTTKYNAASVTLSVTVAQPSAANSSWSDITALSNAGTAANYFSVGDTKTITINGKVGNTTFSNLSIDVFILGFDHNASREGSNRIHFQIGKISGTAVALCDSLYYEEPSGYGYFNWTPSCTNKGGWDACYKRKTLYGNSSTPTNPLANSLMAALPADLRAVLKSVTKYTDNTGGGSNTASYVTATTDYLFDLAEFEVFGNRYCANGAEQNYQVQYDYYKAGNSKIAYNHSSAGTAVKWGLRSPCCNTGYSFCVTIESGSYHANSADRSLGLRPGFSV